MKNFSFYDFKKIMLSILTMFTIFMLYTLVVNIVMYIKSYDTLVNMSFFKMFYSYITSFEFVILCLAYILGGIFITLFSKLGMMVKIYKFIENKFNCKVVITSDVVPAIIYRFGDFIVMNIHSVNGAKVKDDRYIVFKSNIYTDKEVKVTVDLKMILELENFIKNKMIFEYMYIVEELKVVFNVCSNSEADVNDIIDKYKSAIKLEII